MWIRLKIRVWLVTFSKALVVGIFTHGVLVGYHVVLETGQEIVIEVVKATSAEVFIEHVSGEIVKGVIAVF